MDEMAAAPGRVKFLLNWNHFSEHISNCMARLMTDSTYSDVIIATGDRRMIYAHRFVLANSSKYFQRLLRQMNRQRGLQLVLALPEIKYEVLKILMNYMYRGETQVPHDLLPAVINMGRVLEINGLIDLHEAETQFGSNFWNFNKQEPPPPPPPSRSVLRPPRAREEKKETTTTRQSPRTRAKDGANGSSETKRRTRAQNVDVDANSEGGSQKGGNVRRFRPILPKNETATKNGKKDLIHLPLKRKYSKKDQEKEAPTLPLENAEPNQEVAQQEDLLKIKREKLDEEAAWEIENQPAEEVTIKTVNNYGNALPLLKEAPFEIEDANDTNYNELYCETCKENFTGPAEWIQHMSIQHNENGYESNGEAEKEEGNDAVYNCVICSDAMYSASEWIQHIRVWHTDAEPLNSNKSGRRGYRDRDPRNLK